jgi:hypothetical protein
MSQQQDDSASDTTHQPSSRSLSSSLTSLEHIEADRRGSVASGVYERARGRRCTTTLPFHLFSACSTHKRMGYTKTITSLDLSGGVKKTIITG